MKIVHNRRQPRVCFVGTGRTDASTHHISKGSNYLMFDLMVPADMNMETLFFRVQIIRSPVEFSDVPDETVFSIFSVY
jgi:hypothetical protein